jgi:hypothetical protein
MGSASGDLSRLASRSAAVMVGLGVAFVSVHAVRGEVAAGRLHALRLCESAALQDYPSRQHAIPFGRDSATPIATTRPTMTAT